MGAERLQRMFSTNVVGAFLARERRSAHVDEARRQGRRIVKCVLWRGAARVAGEWVDYAASKGAMTP